MKNMRDIIQKSNVLVKNCDLQIAKAKQYYHHNQDKVKDGMSLVGGTAIKVGVSAMFTGEVRLQDFIPNGYLLRRSLAMRKSMRKGILNDKKNQALKEQKFEKARKYDNKRTVIEKKEAEKALKYDKKSEKLAAKIEAKKQALNKAKHQAIHKDIEHKR